MNKEFVVLITLVLAVVILIFVTRAFYIKEILSYEVSRKILHIGAVGISAFAVTLSSQIPNLTWITGFLLIALFILVYRGFFKDPKSGYQSWGIFYFGLSYFVLLLLFPHRLSVVFYSMLTLAIADGFAAITGALVGKHKFSTSEMSKTWEGSLVFLFSCIVCLGVVPVWFPDFGVPIVSLPAILIVSLALTLGESIFEKGTDNLIIPALLVYWMCLDLQFITFAHVAGAMGIVGLGVLAHRHKALSLSGSITAVLMGLILIISPDPIWTVPAMALFIVGTILSKMPGGNESNESCRNSIQVLANGAIPTIALMHYMAIENPAYLFASMSGFSAALSDTASSEIGSRFKQKTFNILNFKQVPIGVSGGVSLVGLIAGLIFAMLIAAITMYISRHIDLYYFLLIGLSGFTGNIVDSIIGAKWQLKYRLIPQGEWSDRKPHRDSFECKGSSWMTNDMVNFLSVLFATVLGFLAYSFL